MTPCSSDNCPNFAKARGLCPLHYQRWLVKRNPSRYSSRSAFKDGVRSGHGGNRTWKFTPEHWFRWWQERTYDPHRAVLAEGIAQMRASFAYNFGAAPADGVSHDELDR